MKTHAFARVALTASFVCGLTYVAGAQQVAITVDATKTGAPISPYMYGFFTELHEANNEGGFWAEMLGDRKFFGAVTSGPDREPSPGRRRRARATRWKPIGPDAFVVMDRQRVWVGEHSPMVKLEAATPNGIAQGGLGVRTGRKYSGRVFLAADPGANVMVSLVWGPNPTDRQNIPIKRLRTEYARFPLSFTAGADSEDARLEIVGTGSGTFHIGAVSLMPADNLYGYRKDLIEEMKKIGPTMFRWPGGNMVSAWDWRDSIGDPDKRAPRLNPAWDEVQQNDLGIDEYMVLNRLLGMEPYICVNAGFGDAHSAAEEVEYVNGAVDTPMGKWRAANGHPAPYKVAWWNIGNEMWSPGQMGFMAVNQYWVKHNMFAQAMRRVDPTIKIVTAGASPVETSQSHAAIAITGKHVAAYGGPADFTGALLAYSSNYFDAAAEHIYPSMADMAFDAEKQDYVKVDEPLVARVRKIANAVHAVVEAWDEYQRRFPNLNMDRYPVALDEWVSEWLGERGVRTPGYSMFAPLSCAQAMQEMFRHSNRFILSAYTAAPQLLAFNKTDATVQPVGLMFELYRRHFGTIPVDVTGNAPQHDVKGTPGVDKGKTSSGSDTYPLDAAAALTADRKAVTVAIVNPTESEQQIDVAIKGVTVQGNGRVWRIAGADLTAANVPGKPLVVDIVESPLAGWPGRLAVPKLSISIYELPLQSGAP
ncbi:MAG: alpha-N-arabinofuranosidase [Acidobacteriota bacterium]